MDDVISLFAAVDGRFAILRRALDDALSAARRLPALERCTPEQAAMPLLREANKIAFGTAPHRPGRRRTWTSVTVSKVLHRLSPNIPIIDARVRAFYGGMRWAGVVRRQLHDDLVRNQAWMAPTASVTRFAPNQCR